MYFESVFECENDVYWRNNRHKSSLRQKKTIFFGCNVLFSNISDSCWLNSTQFFMAALVSNWWTVILYEW